MQLIRNFPPLCRQIGICGEHGGEPNSVQFFHTQGFDYVSCSPFRVPIARISAGQAGAADEIRKKETKPAAGKESD